MKIKRSSSQKQVHKWTRLGIGLLAVAVLGGLVEPVDFKGVGSTEVYANEQVDPALEARKAEIKTMIQSYRDLVGQIKALNPADYTEESWNKNYDGDVRIYLGAQSIAAAYNDDLTFPSVNPEGVDSHQTLNELNATYFFGYQFVENAIPILKQAMTDLVPVSKSLETPPVETKPTETKPSDTKPSASSSSTSPSSTSQSSATNPSASSSSASQSSASEPDETKPTETKVTENQVSISPVYRLYHEDLKVHLYTRDAHEYKVLADRGWRQEGQAFLSASQGSPVYRLYHEGLKVHLYTRDAHEYKVLASRGWRQEGTAFYSVTDGTPVYRLYNEGLQKHLYTTDTNEYKVLATRGWTQEGVAFYSAK
ncbi:TPA: hypothetical protein ACHU7U_001380 [Streptococcus suis]